MREQGVEAFFLFVRLACVHEVFEATRAIAGSQPFAVGR
jgi:hypothetical protein